LTVCAGARIHIMRCVYKCLLLFGSAAGGTFKRTLASLPGPETTRKKATVASRFWTLSPDSRALSEEWISRGHITSVDGQPAELRRQPSGKTQTARLTWKPSGSHVAGYNAYRRKVSGQKYQRLAYADNTVLSCITYYYETRALDDQGHGSGAYGITADTPFESRLSSPLESTAVVT
jgi:hypothetical protein